MERRVPGTTRPGLQSGGTTGRAKELLERWAERLAHAIDAAIDDPKAVAFRGPSDHTLALSGPGETHGRMQYRRLGVAFDLHVAADASVGLVGVRCPLLIGGGSEDGVGLASMEIALVRAEERLAGTYRYGLHPFSGRIRVDPPAFRAAFKHLVRSAGYFIE
jgi:hypothetical protein